MTDPELIARMRSVLTFKDLRLCPTAADRIEQLVVTNEALEAKLAKAVEVLGVLSDYENLDKSSGYYDGECCIFSYQARQRYGDFDDITRATLAEIKGESHE